MVWCGILLGHTETALQQFIFEGEMEQNAGVAESQGAI